LILFAAILLLAGFSDISDVPGARDQVGSGCDQFGHDLKIEAVDSVTIPGYKYNYVFGKAAGIPG